MGKIKTNPPVKLFSGFLFREEKVLKQAENILQKRYGRIDLESAIIPFTYTDYYAQEMGDNLWRKFISFERLIPGQDIYKAKLFSNTIEAKLSTAKKRNINIDPGYLELSKVVLATTKDFSHRIYLNKGIFAEITLIYQNSAFGPLAWTYPDYKTKPYLEFFTNLRKIYACQRK